MAHVITGPCVDVKDKACVPVCPVECIYEGGRMLYIQPDECINCALCLSVCPVQAIHADIDVPEAQRGFVAANAEFFGDAVTGWGSPGGAGPRYVTDRDHALVAAMPRR
ncbi:MAG: ferredoxin family protein [Alphaproteobacteria bacterium]|nr:ferredoxin family protein [Alphaproteobacteria bacterium]